MEFKKGDIYGTHRVISPKGVLPQPADVVDNTMEIYNNEVLIDVHTLNIDSASFTEISNRANGDVEEIKRIILEIVNTTGKHKNRFVIICKKSEHFSVHSFFIFSKAYKLYFFFFLTNCVWLMPMAFAALRVEPYFSQAYLIRPFSYSSTASCREISVSIG